MHQTATPPSHHAPSLRTVLAHDADELASKLTNWQQRYDQVSAGRFSGALTERQLPQLQVFRESLSQAVRQSCRVWPDAIWFGLPDHDTATRINGRQAADNTLMVRPGDVEFELVTAFTVSLRAGNCWKMPRSVTVAGSTGSRCRRPRCCRWMQAHARLACGPCRRRCRLARRTQSMVQRQPTPG